MSTSPDGASESFYMDSKKNQIAWQVQTTGNIDEPPLAVERPNKKNPPVGEYTASSIKITGEEIWSSFSSFPSPSSFPEGVAVDGSGCVWVVDYDSDQAVRYDQTDTEEKSLDVGFPEDIAVVSGTDFSGSIKRFRLEFDS